MPRLRPPSGYEKLNPEDMRDDVMGLLNPVGGFIKVGSSPFRVLIEALLEGSENRLAREGLKRASQGISKFLSKVPAGDSMLRPGGSSKLLESRISREAKPIRGRGWPEELEKLIERFNLYDLTGP